ncbi:MAG: tetratricopeptide repeat protein [Spirochaetaceae bacterium]
MSSTVTTVIALLAIAVAILFFVVISLFRRRGSPGDKTKTHRRDRAAAIREANKALAQNPKDHEAMEVLAGAYFDSQDWEKAMKTYGMLIDLSATVPEVDQHTANLRYGIAALKTGHYKDAYKALVVARSMNPDVFELNFNLGYLEYRRKSYEKAVALLRAANREKPDHLETQRYLAQSLYRIKKFNEALDMLRKVVDAQPDDKEALFVMGKAYYELGQLEQAVRVFSHLRADPTFGPRAALMSGSIQLKSRRYEKAQLDFELGLRHDEIPADVLLELKYRLAVTYIQLQQVEKAVQMLEEIQRTNPDYKDVRQQIQRNRELSRNRNLQTYLIAPPSEFVALCRRIATGFFDHARVKITDVSVSRNEYADILTEVETSKWVDTILFRFIRTSGQVGELVLRDFHGRIKDVKAGRGFCVTAGEFTEGARQFVEARLIDLVAKDQLMQILQRA